MEKMASKGRNKALHIEKEAHIKGEKGPINRNVYSKDGEGILVPQPSASAHERVIIKCTILSEIINHIIISKYTLEYTQLSYLIFKNFSENLEFPLNKIEQRYTRRTIDNSSGMYYNTSLLYLKHYTSMFENGFLPLMNDHHSFKQPPPLDNDRVCDHNAMIAFPQEKTSHYTV